MQATTPHLSSTAAYAFLDALPDKIKGAIIAYAADGDYPVEAVLEMAIAGFLDPDSISFVDCNPLAVVNDLKKAG
ncbi:MAG: hypothetical protein HC789_12070 [Microcoleus sp. CSU_2_2]|nr:hypothetical protein [Microcoleus sp. SU_5_3]NJS11047.1 hypothetical protein [Microcoleus sp. CSU_2_2]